MRAIKELSSLSIGVTYDVVLRNARPARGRLLTISHDGSAAVFIIDGDQRMIEATRFLSAKPVTGRWLHR